MSRVRDYQASLSLNYALLGPCLLEGRVALRAAG